MPPRIAALPVDPDRGYPVPFFVSYVDGKPEFRLADAKKRRACILDNLCWVCGQELGRFKSFVIGPMCSINRISADPCLHLDCAEWSVQACPFMLKPQMVRREDEVTIAAKERNPSPGVMIERNPGVMLIWTTRSFTMVRDGDKGILFRLGEPKQISWWREGRRATRAEILESIESGVPLLRQYCDCPEAHAALDASIETALTLLPL